MKKQDAETIEKIERLERMAVDLTYEIENRIRSVSYTQLSRIAREVMPGYELDEFDALLSDINRTAFTVLLIRQPRF